VADPRAAWVALALVGGVGGRTVTRLLRRFGSLEAALAAPQDALLAVPGVGPHTARAIAAADLPAAADALAALAADGVRALTWGDAAYPANLLYTLDAPPVLFVRGALAAADSRAVAVVGTRSPTARSAELAHTLACGLARLGWTVVSGLALGIDAAAHRGALSAGGRTLAALGSGVLSVYPARHADLAAEVAAQGALLCEVHPHARVSRPALIARNRITSGLSRAVIVVQSSEDSGSLNTAHWARKQGRAVFAIVGGGQGGDALIEAGATPLDPDRLDLDALSAQLDAAPLPDQRADPTADQPPLI
jgi:DNA processing protein